MNRFKSKKGFTLAELLIVVAIIAVLVAVAVPIFVTALSKAEQGVIDANERSLKAMAVTVILSDEDKDYLHDEDGTTLYKDWKVTGKYVAATDTIVISSITGSTKGGTKIADDEKSKKTTDGYNLAIVITASDLTVG